MPHCLKPSFKESWEHLPGPAIQPICNMNWPCLIGSGSGNRHLFGAVSASQEALVVKNPPANAGNTRDTGLIPGWGRSPGGGHGNPLQYSCLENPMDRGAWLATVHGVTKSQTRLKQLSTHTSVYQLKGESNRQLKYTYKDKGFRQMNSPFHWEGLLSSQASGRHRCFLCLRLNGSGSPGSYGSFHEG